MNNCASTSVGTKFTVIAYVLPDGGHYVATIAAADATTAAVAMREKLELKREDFEIVAVIKGEPIYENVDPTKVALAPFSATSP